MSGGAAGRVLLNGKDAGSGFAITEGRALTAGHVVRDAPTMAGGRGGEAAEPPSSVLEYVADRGEAVEVPVVVAYRPEDGEPIPVTRIEVNTSLDVAVLYLQRPAPAVLPAAGQVTAGEQWRVETQPKPDDPVLEGTVTEPQRRLKNMAGQQTTLVQLWVQEELGDYKGYSGSPVIAPAAAGMPGRVLGVLVEQGRWRTSPLGQPPPVANVLFAAPIDQVLAEFDLAGVAVARSVIDIPLPVSYEVPRPEQLNQVIGTLTSPSPDGQLVGLAGMGGAGKSVLAAAAARDPKVAETFPDGRFWLELGPDPPLLQLQASLAAALGDGTPVTDVPQGRARLSRLLGERGCLLVLDNVWDQAHLAAFDVVGSAGRVLVTTRDAATLPSATIITLGEFDQEQGMRLLAGWAATQPGDLPPEAEQVARECGYLPLALALCGAMIAEGSHTWPQLLALLRGADLDEVRSRLVDYPHPSLAVALGASLATLTPDAGDRYLRLAVFNGQGPVPPAAVEVLWGLDQQHAATLIADLARRSLLRWKGNGRVSLHDLQMDYLTRLTPDVAALHGQLLDAYRGQGPGGWATGPDDGYFYQHLAHHLHQAGRDPELQALLLDPAWMRAELAAGNLAGLIADYDTLPADPTLRLVAGALRLSAHVLAGDPGQLPGQLTGRLVGQDGPLLRDLLQRTRYWPAPWLRPLTGTLIPPGGPLLRTLASHNGPVKGVAITADGRRAVSGGGDRTVRVWDLEAGELLHTLTGHNFEVTAVAISADGRRAVSGALRTVWVWDLEAGELLHTLTAHTMGVLAVAVTADGRRAVSGGDDMTVRVWDLEAGELLHTLTGHNFEVTAVAISADGRRAVSGALRTVWVWDLEAGQLLHTLTAHTMGVLAVAVSADGRRAVSGSHDQTVRVWDLEAGELLHTLTGHDDPEGAIPVNPVWAVAVTADGRRALSGDGDRAVRVWDLEAGELLRTLAGHDDGVLAVAVTADGRRAVSGGGDRTVRVWDLEAGELLRTLAGHDDGVLAVAVTADGRRAVSGGGDRTVRVWDLEAGELPHTLAGYYRGVSAVAISADGRRAVSGGDDATVRVWDLAAGQLLHTLTGHDRTDNAGVTAVAVSADGRRAVSSGTDRTVRVWDLEAGQLLHTLTRHDRGVSAVAVTADGRRAVSSGGLDRTVRVWDLEAGELLHTLTGPDDRVLAVAVTADGHIVSGSKDGPLWLWDVATGQRLASAGQSPTQRLLRWWRGPAAPGARSFVFSADGRRAVSLGPGGTVRVWDPEAGQLLHTLTRHDSGVTAVAVSADGRRAVSGGGPDRTVRVWDLQAGQLLHALAGHDSGVTAVAVSADGHRAVSGDGSGTVRMWNLTQGAELASFVSGNSVTVVAVTPAGTRVVAGTKAGPVHLLELCGHE